MYPKINMEILFTLKLDPFTGLHTFANCIYSDVHSDVHSDVYSDVHSDVHSDVYTICNYTQWTHKLKSESHLKRAQLYTKFIIYIVLVVLVVLVKLMVILKKNSLWIRRV